MNFTCQNCRQAAPNAHIYGGFCNRCYHSFEQIVRAECEQTRIQTEERRREQIRRDADLAQALARQLVQDEARPSARPSARRLAEDRCIEEMRRDAEAHHALARQLEQGVARLLEERRRADTLMDAELAFQLQQENDS